MPAPMPASWLRAMVAIANPSAASSLIASQPRTSFSGSPPIVVASSIPAVPTPAIRLPMAAAMTPKTNAISRPMPTRSATAANVTTM